MRPPHATTLPVAKDTFTADAVWNLGGLMKIQVETIPASDQSTMSATVPNEGIHITQGKRTPYVRARKSEGNGCGSTEMRLNVVRIPSRSARRYAVDTNYLQEQSTVVRVLIRSAC